MEERRKISRVDYEAKGVIVICDSLEKIYADVVNISPLGIALKVPEGTQSMLGKDVIVVAETLIMYADAIREDKNEDGSVTVAVSARRFTPEVLKYLFEHITDESDK